MKLIIDPTPGIPHLPWEKLKRGQIYAVYADGQPVIADGQHLVMVRANDYHTYNLPKFHVHCTSLTYTYVECEATLKVKVP